MQELEGSPRLFVTTQAILFEVGDALAKPKYRASACRLLDALQNDSRTQIVPLSEALCARGLNLFRQRADKEWELTDCISLVVLGDLGLTQALAADEHFEQAGFQALLRRPAN